jgi:hypothetical protein
VPLPTFSLTSQNDAWDETPSIDAVAVMWPVAAIQAVRGDCAFYASEAAYCEDLPHAEQDNGESLFAAAADRGVRVLFTGIWVTNGSPAHFSMPIYPDRTTRSVLASLCSAADRQDVFGPLSMFRSAIWPLVPASAKDHQVRAGP